jgi:hypothetical protein
MFFKRVFILKLVVFQNYWMKRLCLLSNWVQCLLFTWVNVPVVKRKIRKGPLMLAASAAADGTVVVHAGTC